MKKKDDDRVVEKPLDTLEFTIRERPRLRGTVVHTHNVAKKPARPRNKPKHSLKEMDEAIRALSLVAANNLQEIKKLQREQEAQQEAQYRREQAKFRYSPPIPKSYR